jgi:hypothetical protein
MHSPRNEEPSGRPVAVTVLGYFFVFGAAVSALSLVALIWPNGPLEPMWRLNPRAKESFAALGYLAIVLMAVVSALCTATAIGLLQGRRFGLILGLTMLVISMLGDVANALLGIEPRAWLGVPVAALLLAGLAAPTSRSFLRR